MGEAIDLATKISVRDITADEIAAYRANGVAYMPAVVDAQTCELLLDAVDERIAAFQRERGIWQDNLTGNEELFFNERNAFERNRIFREFTLNKKMAENAAKAMGAKRIHFYFDHIFALAPDAAKDQYYWHQDQPYWGCVGEQVCSFWLALTPCAIDSGALEFVLGTDKGKLYLPSAFGAGVNEKFPVSEKQPDYHLERDKYEIVSWEIRPGDCLLFNTKIMHSSRGNHSKTHRRVAYSTRWIGEDVLFAKKQGFQDPVTYPEDGFVERRPLWQSARFPLVWDQKD